MKTKNMKLKVKKKHPIRRFILWSFFLLILTVIIASVAFVAYYYPKVPSLNTSLFEYSQNAIIYDRYNEPYQNLQGEENRQTVSSEQIPDMVKNAFIAIEDKRFYSHNGVDILAIGRALSEVILNRNLNGSGGSTITQQLIKLTHLTSEKSLERKFDEWVLALRLEEVYSKDQILTAYLNKVNFHGAEGIQAAAQQYFGKNVDELDIAQAAILAAIPNSPNYFDPYTYNENQEIIYSNDQIVLNPNNQTRALNVVNELVDQGYITEQEGADAKYEIKTNPGLIYNNPNKVYSYFTDAIYNQILEDLQIALELPESEVVKFINTSGLKIYSTVDPDVQSSLEQLSSTDSLYPAASSEAQVANDALGTNYQPEVGMTVVSNEDGSVLGMVGGRDNNASLTLNRATNSYQTGSSTKPITTYGPALEEEICTLSTVYNDQPLDINGWKPKNSSGSYIGPTTVRNALINSINTVAVQIDMDLGIAKSADYARKLGLTITNDDLNAGALALGGYYNGQSTVQMAGAFATLARGGDYIEPYLYTQVVDNDGNILIDNQQIDSQTIFSPETCYLITNTLEQAINGGTTNISVRGTEVAGKTGTTDNQVNAYFCGYSPTYSMAIWYGYDANEVTVNGQTLPLKIGIFGGDKPGPALMFEAVMNQIEKDTNVKTFEKPASLIEAKTSDAENSPTEYYIEGTEPGSNANQHNDNSQEPSEKHVYSDYTDYYVEETETSFEYYFE